MPAEPDKRLMAYSAAGMFGGAVAIDLVESLVPGGESFSLLPGFVALALAVLLVLHGTRLPLVLMAALGPLGVAMIAFALASTNVAGDGAVLYAWPVLWEAYFFGRRGTILILASVAVAHALALLALPTGNLDRWIDVMASTTIIAVVVGVLARRNRQLLERISREARVDNLTGLLNRRGFDERAETELARARRDRTWLAVVTFDLDYFKRVNDEFGHDVGDRVLVSLAACFRAAMRETDIIARMGGEEFLALLPEADADQARAFAERVREFLDERAGEGSPRVTTSAGVAAALAPDRLGPLLRAADVALYAAKADGRNRIVVGPVGGSRIGAPDLAAREAAPQPPPTAAL